MAICFNCKREIEDNHPFCGYCGASQKPSVNVIIDGRKDKIIKYLINRVCHFEKINILFSLLFVLVVTAGIMILYSNISDFILRLRELPSVMTQLGIKYEYVKEGLGFEYLNSEIKFLISFTGIVLNIITSGYLTCVGIFFLIFNLNILWLRHKYKENYCYKKPLRLIKLSSYVAKVSVILIALMAFLWIVLAITGLILL